MIPVLPFIALLLFEALAPLENHVLTVPEAAALLRVGERTLRSAIARGEVPARRIGRRIVVPGAALARWLEAQEQEGAGPEAGAWVRPLARSRRLHGA